MDCTASENGTISLRAGAAFNQATPSDCFALRLVLKDCYILKSSHHYPVDSGGKIHHFFFFRDPIVATFFLGEDNLYGGHAMNNSSGFHVSQSYSKIKYYLFF